MDAYVCASCAHFHAAAEQPDRCERCRRDWSWLLDAGPDVERAEQLSELALDGRWRPQRASRRAGLASAAGGGEASARPGGAPWGVGGAPGVCGPGIALRLPRGRSSRRAGFRRFAVAWRRALRAGSRRVRSTCRRGGRPGMPTPHTRPGRKPASPAQQRYLRSLAEQTGTTFTPPVSSADASRQIEQLKARARSGRREIARERRQVQADMALRGDAARHVPGDVAGHGSTARWAHNTQEDTR